jgi:hypothetical protein
LFSPCGFAHAALLLQMISACFTPSTIEGLSLKNGGTLLLLIALSRVLGRNSLVPFSLSPLYSPLSFFDDELSKDPLPFNLKGLALSLKD